MNPTTAIPAPSGQAAGLSAQEAATRLAADGPNALGTSQRRTLWRSLAELVRDPMLQLLVAAGVIYLLLGSRGEALMLLAFVAVTIVISVVEEQRTERVLEALRDLTSPRALVLRDGQTCRIAGTEVVRGDLLLLAEGDRVAADARLLRANDLQTDESLLSGESLPVRKQVGAAPPSGSSAQDEGVHAVFAGSVVVGGQGLAEVTATGPRSAFGRIGKSLGEISSPPSPLHLQTQRMVRLFSIAGLALSAAVVVLYGFSRGDWLGGVLAGITLAMSLLPQEFLLILTVFMAMGAWRMSRERVLARRNSTIETLGSATVLCTDKTGTLTENRMAVEAICVWQVAEPGQATGLGPGWMRWNAADTDLPAACATLLELAILASEREPFDAMERALHASGHQHLPLARFHTDWTLVHEYPLSDALPAMTHVWRTADGMHCVAIKGGSEAVADVCQLPPDQRAAVATQTLELAAQGLRVLGFRFEWLGLVAFADPLRPEVPAAIAQCTAAGLRVVMITGDHPATALAIARQAGLKGAANGSGSLPLQAITGAELDALTDVELQQHLNTNAVFARIKPHQKLRIVEAFKASGQVVAMTGDGVNDAPSLKAAHIGIAMGGRGTDVAREASSLVLLDDNFGAIVVAVRLGRRIFDNLRKALAFVLAVHVPIAGLSLLPLMVGWPVILSPVHIAFLELLISPVCSIVFEAEPEEDDVMQRPPRNPQVALFSHRLMAWSAAQGVLVWASVAGLYAVLQARGIAADQVRALTFTALISGNLALIMVNRALHGGAPWASWARPNAWLWRTLGATVLLLACALWIPALREVFRFGQAPWPLLAVAACLGLPVWLALEGLKRLWQAQPTAGQRRTT
ncbi:MAG: ATPase [Burkholderiales bacterium PBB4]|nr:MAG: ATPase [Burkholderiales bacterium PBB4]